MKEIFLVGNNYAKCGEITVARLPEGFPDVEFKLSLKDIIFHSESNEEDLFIMPIAKLNVKTNNIGILMNPIDLDNVVERWEDDGT